jgi:hypothetical protein
LGKEVSHLSQSPSSPIMSLPTPHLLSTSRNLKIGGMVDKYKCCVFDCQCGSYIISMWTEKEEVEINIRRNYPLWNLLLFRKENLEFIRDRGCQIRIYSVKDISLLSSL